MDVFFKAAAMAVVTVVLYLILSRQNKDIAVLLSIAACCAIITMAVSYLDPVFSFFEQLQSIGNLDSELLTILLKSVGIGLLSEIASLICADAGNSALGKAIHIMAVGVILWISLPLFSSLMDLISEILGKA